MNYNVCILLLLLLLSILYKRILLFELTFIIYIKAYHFYLFEK